MPYLKLHSNIFLYFSILCSLLIISFPAYAIHHEHQTDNEHPTDEVVVTGTRTVFRSALDTPAPVDILSAEDLSATGHTETGRAIQTLAPSLNFPSSSIADGTDSLKPATLRGLGPDQTLVLLNGTRRHKSALLHVNTSVGRGTAGTDLNAIPTSFLHSVDIYRDGAGAQYGSDAIAGVINLHLKEVSDGEALLSYGQTTKNDGNAYLFAINKGVALPNDGFLFLGYEYLNRGKTNRSGLSGTVLYSGDAGTSDPSTCNATTNTGCDPKESTANRHNFIIGDPKSEQHSFAYNAGITLAEIELRSFFIWSDRENQSTGFFREPDDSTRNIVSIYPDGFLPEINTDIVDVSFGVSAAKELAKGKLKVSYTLGRNEFDFYITNSLNASFGDNSPTEADSGGLSYQEHILNTTYIHKFNDSTTLAVGSELKREIYKIRAGEPLSYINCNTDDNAEALTGITGCEAGKVGGIQVFPGFRPENSVDEHRDNLALHAELSHEIKSALITGAIRYEYYDKIGNIFVGKVSAFNEFNETHAIRASVSNGFRAPSLHQLHFNTIGTSSVDGILTQTGTFNNDNALTKELGISRLKEEKSINFGIGYIFTPTHNLTLTVDAYHIDISDRIILSGVIKSDNPNLSSEAVAIMATRDITAAQFMMNGPDTRTQGLDIVASYTPQIPIGTLNFKLSGNYTVTKVRGNINAPTFLQGLEKDLFSERDQSIIESWQPKSRIIFQTNYSIKDVTFSGIINYYGAYKSSEGLGDNYEEQKHSGAFVTDIRIHWEFIPNFALSLIGDNIFNQYPEHTTLQNSRGGEILDIVDSAGAFTYSRRTAPYGFNGAYWGIQLKANF